MAFKKFLLLEGGGALVFFAASLSTVVIFKWSRLLWTHSNYLVQDGVERFGREHEAGHGGAGYSD